MGFSNSIPVDFNNCDDDGAVRLVTRGTIEFIKNNNIDFCEGETISMSDGELHAEGVTKCRNGMWVAVVSNWHDEVNSN